MDFEGVDQRRNPTTRKTLPPSMPPQAKKRANPAEEKKKTNAQEKERQERITIDNKKFRLQSIINMRQKELDALKKKEMKRSGQSGSKRISVTKEQLLQQVPSTHSSLKSSGTPSRKSDKEKEEKTAQVPSTPSTKEPPKKRSTLLATLPVKLKSAAQPPAPHPSEVASGSKGQTGKFDKQPSGAASRQAKVENQLEKGILEFDQMEIEEVLPGPTPSQGLLSGASARVFRSLTQNPLDAKMDLSVPVFGGEEQETDDFSLNVTKCSTDVLEQLSDMGKVVGVSDPHLMPTEVNVILESCAQVFKEAGASEGSARNLTWAIVRNILRRCGKPDDVLALGHFHHPKYFGLSAKQFQDIWPPWVHFMEENLNSDLAQKPEVLGYIGQMVSWTASCFYGARWHERTSESAGRTREFYERRSIGRPSNWSRMVHVRFESLFQPNESR